MIIVPSNRNTERIALLHRALLSLFLLGLVAPHAIAQAAAPRRPNIVLMMCDDLGWGDLAYNGHPHVETPSLDRMSTEGIRFDRWYSGAPLCSPTRFSCLTGRNPFRIGLWEANVNCIRRQESTLAEALKTLGYTTGHFGKWHLGTLRRESQTKYYQGDASKKNYQPPDQHGFDEWFSTEYAVPTWDPYLAAEKNPYVKTGGVIETENLQGDDSRVILDRAIPFIRKAHKQSQPFFTVIWFHTPHGPVRGGPQYRARYAQYPEQQQHYYACITAMDEQVGRLRTELDQLGCRDNTMFWFCSDNGPTGVGTAKPFRGYKSTLWEGGVRVPGMLVWPEKIAKPRIVDMACSTLDYYPTILDLLGLNAPGQIHPLDGMSLRPLIEGGELDGRPQPLAFECREAVALIDNRYKLLSIRTGVRGEEVRPEGTGDELMLFDLIDDPGESNNIAGEHPEIVRRMAADLDRRRNSWQQSFAGVDYPGTFSDIRPWLGLPTDRGVEQLGEMRPSGTQPKKINAHP